MKRKWGSDPSITHILNVFGKECLVRRVLLLLLLMMMMMKKPSTDINIELEYMIVNISSVSLIPFVELKKSNIEELIMLVNTWVTHHSRHCDQNVVVYVQTMAISFSTYHSREKPPEKGRNEIQQKSIKQMKIRWR